MRQPVLALSLLLPLSGLWACAPEGPVVDGMGPEAGSYQKIYGGSAPDAWYHDAVVSLHEVVRGRVYTDPFCTGTLVSEDVVVTAAHCLAAGSGVMSPSQIAVYVGDNPYVDLTSHLYLVTDLAQHSSYDSRRIRNDIGLITLASPITEAVTPVPPLPASSQLTTADVGATVNFAGFGTTASGGYGEKLQIDLTLGGLGCTVSGCTSAGDSATQVSYRQSAGGPCSGDSGGPMFVFRGSNAYLGGVTSYGDYYCAQYGVSTRVDAYESWISSYTGTSTGGGSTCSGFDDSYTGSLTGAGDYAYEPGGSSYSAARGTHEAELTGPSSADFDLYLYRNNRRTGAWTAVAASEGTGSSESISYSGAAGTYIWVVMDYSGSGSYSLCTTTP